MKRVLLYVSVIVASGFLGYLYWLEVGCNSGSCAITSDPVNSTLYGAVMGGLISMQIRDVKRRKKSKENWMQRHFNICAKSQLIMTSVIL